MSLTKRSYTGKNILILIPLFLVIVAAIFSLQAWLLELAINYAVSPLFGTPEISFGQACLLLLGLGVVGSCFKAVKS